MPTAITSFNMRPSFTIDDAGDGDAVDSVFVREDHASFAACDTLPDATHTVFGQLGVVSVFAASVCAVVVFVLSVGVVSVPSQIVQAIVLTIPVTVATLLAFRAGSDKGRQDERVDRMGLGVSVFVKNDCQWAPSVVLVAGRAKLASFVGALLSVGRCDGAGQAPYVAEVADFVPAFVPDDGFPLFCHGDASSPMNNSRGA